MIGVFLRWEEGVFIGEGRFYGGREGVMVGRGKV